MKNKRGQVMIFIIIGIIIVFLGVAIYMFYPDIKTNIETEPKTPNAFIQNCLQEDLENSVEKISTQGGFMTPELYFLKNDEKIGYLCYTNEYYKPCVMQQPLLKRHIEEELKEELEGQANECFNALVENYRNKNYVVNLKKGEMAVEILPNRISILFNNSLSLTRGSTENYKDFKVSINSALYNLLGIANSILEWEATYGDAETTEYMNYYKDIKVEKNKQTDSTTIYVITNRDTNDKFQFASRSIAWPPGY